jgi:signal transduction histidine kinase
MQFFARLGFRLTFQYVLFSSLGFFLAFFIGFGLYAAYLERQFLSDRLPDTLWRNVQVLAEDITKEEDVAEAFHRIFQDSRIRLRFPVNSRVNTERIGKIFAAYFYHEEGRELASTLNTEIYTPDLANIQGLAWSYAGRSFQSTTYYDSRTAIREPFIIATSNALGPPGDKVVLVVVAEKSTLETPLGFNFLLSLIRDAFQVMSFLLPVLVVFGLLFGWISAHGIVRRIRNLTKESEGWAEGRFIPIKGSKQKDELDELAMHFNSLGVKLQNLLQTRQELAVSDTRNRIARDLHDSVKQQMFALSLQLKTAEKLVGNSKAVRHLEIGMDIGKSIQAELDNLIHNLTPVGLEERGVEPLVSEYAEKWAEYYNLSLDVSISGRPEPPVEYGLTAYRIVQESLSNISRHSGADSARLKLNWDDEKMHIVISDNGSGLPMNEREGNGIRFMKERIVNLGGNIRFNNNRGCTIEIEIPIELRV